MAARLAKVKVILARQSADRDPLTPSSLLLADSAVVRAKRLSRFFDEPLPTRSIARPSSAPFKIQPPTLPIPPAINELRVTAFRDYLLCPYRFYLRHVRKLVTVDDHKRSSTPRVSEASFTISSRPSVEAPSRTHPTPAPSARLSKESGAIASGIAIAARSLPSSSKENKSNVDCSLSPIGKPNGSPKVGEFFTSSLKPPLPPPPSSLTTNPFI